MVLLIALCHCNLWRRRLDPRAPDQPPAEEEPLVCRAGASVARRMLRRPAAASTSGASSSSTAATVEGAEAELLGFKTADVAFSLGQHCLGVAINNCYNERPQLPTSLNQTKLMKSLKSPKLFSKWSSTMQTPQVTFFTFFSFFTLSKTMESKYEIPVHGQSSTIAVSLKKLALLANSLSGCSPGRESLDVHTCSPCLQLNTQICPAIDSNLLPAALPSAVLSSIIRSSKSFFTRLKFIPFLVILVNF